MKMKVDFHRTVTVSFLDSSGSAWELPFFIGRCMERDQLQLRAYQISVLWISISLWFNSPIPQTHGFFTKDRC